MSIKLNSIVDIKHLESDKFFYLFDELSLYNKFKLVYSMVDYISTLDVLLDPRMSNYLEFINLYSPMFISNHKYITQLCEQYKLMYPDTRLGSINNNILSEIID